MFCIAIKLESCLRKVESAMDEYGKKGDVCTGYPISGDTTIKEMILHKKINFKWFITKMD